MIINGYKILHIHIPKCGGSSITQLLEKYRVEKFNRKSAHSDYNEYVKRIGNEIENYKVFTVVRNPWEWHVSWYHYLKNIKPSIHGHYVEHNLFNKKNHNFNEYVKWLTNDNKKKSEQEFILKNQYDWCINSDDEFKVDHILKLENIDSDYLDFCKIYGIKENVIPVTNKGKHSKYEKYYNSETKDIISKLHKKDIVKFKYSF